MYTYIALILFLLISTLVCLDHRTSERASIYIFIFDLLLIYLISGFRYYVGQDYQHYIDQYTYVKSLGIDGTYTEIGFSLLLWALVELNAGPLSVFIVSSGILSLCLGYAVIRLFRRETRCLALLIFTTFGFFFSSMNLVRQYIAGSFILLAFTRDSDKKGSIEFVALIVLGALFHTSALFVLAVEPLRRIATKDFGDVVFLVLYSISLIFVLIDVREILKIIIPLLPRWDTYLSDTSFTERNNLALIKNIVPNVLLILCVYLARRHTGKHEDESRQFAGMFLYVITQNMFFGVTALTRISELFFLPYIFCTCSIGEMIEQKKCKYIYYAILMVYGIILTTYTIFINNGNGVIPYQSMLFNG